MEHLYNTQKEDLVLKEYGRNIQKLVTYVKNMEDPEKRNIYSRMLVDLMRQVNPTTRDSTENQNKVWDDLFLMSKLELDIESPFPMPEKENLGKKPKKLPYNNHDIRYRHYGRNIELLLNETATLETIEERISGFVIAGKLMKSFYAIWNKENIENTLIFQHMAKILGKEVEAEIIEVIEKKNLLNTYIPKEKNNHSRNNRKGGRRTNNRKRN